MQLGIERTDRDQRRISRTRLTGENYKLSADRDRCRIYRRGQTSQPARPLGAKNLLQRGRDIEKILEILEASPEN